MVYLTEAGQEIDHAIDVDKGSTPRKSHYIFSLSSQLREGLYMYSEFLNNDFLCVQVVPAETTYKSWSWNTIVLRIPFYLIHQQIVFALLQYSQTPGALQGSLWPMELLFKQVEILMALRKSGNFSWLSPQFEQVGASCVEFLIPIFPV